MYTAHFAKLAAEEEEKRHEALRNIHVSVTHDHNKLYIENVRLIKELAKRDPISLIGPKPEEIEKLKEYLQRAKMRQKRSILR